MCIRRTSVDAGLQLVEYDSMILAHTSNFHSKFSLHIPQIRIAWERSDCRSSPAHQRQDIQYPPARFLASLFTPQSLIQNATSSLTPPNPPNMDSSGNAGYTDRWFHRPGCHPCLLVAPRTNALHPILFGCHAQRP